MFSSANNILEDYLKSNKTIESSALILAEWNMNDPENVEKLGNYRTEGMPIDYDPNDNGNHYTGATDSDVEIEGPYDFDQTVTDSASYIPTVFLSKSEKNKMLFSLDDCLKPHRPRSGINYMQYLPGDRFFGKLSPIPSDRYSNTVNRPRYYMPSYDSKFKYWSSLRFSGSGVRGVSYERDAVGRYLIEDANPFVVYKNPVPTNKLVIKMQTHVGTVSQGNDDPFYGQENSSTPKQWKVQGLAKETVGGFVQQNSWKDLMVFEESAVRPDGSPIIKEDGYVELFYGIKIPAKYYVNSSGEDVLPDYLGELSNVSSLPDSALDGEYYLSIPDSGAKGLIYIWFNGVWEPFIPDYGWQLVQNYDPTRNRYIPDLTNPASFLQSGVSIYRDFQYLRGIRIVCTSMNKAGATLDLIEMSPRLIVDVTSRTASVQAGRSIGRVDQTALPVGGLVAGTGEIEIFDDDDSFNENNDDSLVSEFMNENITFTIYDAVKNVGVSDVTQATYYIPIKTLYTEGLYPSYRDEGTVSWQLRDFYYYLENMPAPRLMIRNVSLSVAVSLLLDSIGFSNYSFFRATKDDGSYYPEPLIPFFFIGPDKNVAEVLEQLAVATQSAMFFDEYNNFVVMFKEFILGDRNADLILHGNNTFVNDDGVTEEVNPDIVNIASREKKTFNAGTINYTERYIQRSAGSLLQAGLLNVDQELKYLPALLWEVSGEKRLRTINDQAGEQSGYALSAVPLQFNLSASVPTVSSGRVVNNTFDLGEGIYWVSDHAGYFFSNGEIIRYDALQYNVQGVGNVWISSNDEYQEYVGQLAFGGKIYPTGKVRIFTEVRYKTEAGESVSLDSVKSHGRGQFQTNIVSHSAGLDNYWANPSGSTGSTKGIATQSKYLFEAGLTPPATSPTPPATMSTDNAKALGSSRFGVIKNFLRNIEYGEAQSKALTASNPAAVQSSAFNLVGPAFTGAEVPRDFLTLSYKNLYDPGAPQGMVYKHFGTRMRVVGQVDAITDSQNPTGETSYYTSTANGETLILNGGSGGIFFGLNPTTMSGYFVELMAITNNNLELLSGDEDSEAVAHNVVLYKMSTDQTNGKATPIKLWGGTANILVDDGKFTGQARSSTSEYSTVYDLSVEYEQLGSGLRFYVFLNDQQVAVVDDTAPIPLSTGAGMFVRGASHCMFENFFAVGRNVADYGDFTIVAKDAIPKAFGLGNVTAKSTDRLSLSGIVQKSYLSGISPVTPNTYRIFYEEFGTIMREVGYFNIKYDKAYPALWSQISPTFNDTPGYIVSGYTADAYGAKFLVFNMTDTVLNLDDTSGNYLRIQGITFTQNTTHDYTMDQHFNLVGNPSNLSDDNSFIVSSVEKKDQYRDIRLNRMKYGSKDFSLSSDYIQTQSSARNLMGWLADKSIRNRLQIGVEMFNNPLVQLGDVVRVNYSMKNIDKVISSDVKFVVYNIEYGRSVDGPTMTIYASEV